MWLSNRDGVILPIWWLSGGPGLGSLRNVCTTHGPSLRLKVYVQGFGQSPRSGSNGSNGPMYFDQRRLRVESRPGRAAVSSNSPHRAWLTRVRIQPNPPLIWMEGNLRHSHPPKPAWGSSDIGRGWALWPVRSFSSPMSALKGITFRLV